jgi:hypothetical protein
MAIDELEIDELAIEELTSPKTADAEELNRIYSMLCVVN